MGQRKSNRTRAVLLIDWTPPRVWMETLEARTLLSLDLTADTEVREGYFEYWSAGSSTELFGKNLVWGDSHHYSGPIATFRGDMPDLQHVYVGLRTESQFDSAPEWIPATLVDLPGPTFEVHAEITAKPAWRDQPLRTDIAMVDDVRGFTYLRPGTGTLFLTDRKLITTEYTSFEGGVPGWSNAQLRVRSFYARDDSRDAKFSVDIDWMDGTPVENRTVTGYWYDGLYFDVEHPMRQGIRPRMTVSTLDGSDSFSGLVELDTRSLEPQPQTQERSQNPPGANGIYGIIDSTKEVTVLGPMYTSGQIPQETRYTVNWPDGTSEQAVAELVSQAEQQAGIPSTAFTYQLRVKPRQLPAGHIRFSMTITEAGGRTCIPDIYLFGVDGTIQDAGLYDLPRSEQIRFAEGTHDDYAFFYDAPGFASDQYSAWYEFDDGTRGNAKVFARDDFRAGANWLQVQANFVLWPDGTPPALRRPGVPITALRIPATLVVERSESRISVKTTIVLGESSSWIIPASAEALRAAGVPGVTVRDDTPDQPAIPLPEMPPAVPDTVDPVLEDLEIDGEDLEDDYTEVDGGSFSLAGDTFDLEPFGSGWSADFFAEDKGDLESELAWIDLIG